MMQVHISTIYRLVLTGKLPARKRGGHRYLIRRADMLKFMEGEPAPTPWAKPDGWSTRTPRPRPSCGRTAC